MAPILVAIATVAVLLLMGRAPFCSCEEIMPWVGEAGSLHTSKHFLDPYSFSHFQHGLIFFYFLSIWKKPPKLTWALSIEAAWEILENTPLVIERYRSVTASANYLGDTVLNSFGDLVSCALGFYVATKFSARVSILAFVAIEVAMLYLIKDSLLLNVLMLVYPLASIKNWQTS